MGRTPAGHRRRSIHRCCLPLAEAARRLDPAAAAAALLALACGVGALAAAEPLIAGSKRFNESYILGEIVRQTLQAQGVAAQHKPGLGNTGVLKQALAAGTVDMVINVGTATVAAFVGAGGFSERVVAGLAVNDSQMMLAGALPAAALALALQASFKAVERRLLGMRSRSI